MRALRRQAGHQKLIGLAALLPDIPYVRLSKIERGEVVAKASELHAVATALGLEPEKLILDVATPDFDMADWAEELQDWVAVDPEEDRFAVMLAAALRARRAHDRSLSIAAIERDYGIAPVILSRLENAVKPIDRWNEHIQGALCRLFDVADVAALRAHVTSLRADGTLTPYLDLIANPDHRIAKTQARVDALRTELSGAERDAPSARPRARQPRRLAPMTQGIEAQPAPGTEAPIASALLGADMATVRLVPVFGQPLPDGLIARTPVGEVVEAPRRAGPNAYGLRICRPTLGPGLPARTTVIVDPDRFPSSGGIAVVREPQGLRLLTVTFDRNGRMIGYSENPDREVPLDALDPGDVATVIGAVLD